MPQSRARLADPAILDDAELVRCALARDPDPFRGIMQRHNQRLYRIARSVLRNSTEAEDAVQEAYVSAFTHLKSDRGESSLADWLARITMNATMSFHIRDMLLMTGDYLTIVPACMLHVLNAKRPTVKPLPIDLGVQTRPVAIFTLKNRTLTPLAELFMQSVRAVAKSITSAK